MTIAQVTYPAVVVSVHVHNDALKAKDVWMPAGFFWTQPDGEVHIASTRGHETIAYAEIDNGMYPVLPTGRSK